MQSSYTSITIWLAQANFEPHFQIGREMKKKDALKKVYKVAEKVGKVTLGGFAFFFFFPQMSYHCIKKNNLSTTTSKYEMFI